MAFFCRPLCKKSWKEWCVENRWSLTREHHLSLGELRPKVVLVLSVRLSSAEESSLWFHILVWCSLFMLCHCIAKLFTFHEIVTFQVYSCKLLSKPFFSHSVDMQLIISAYFWTFHQSLSNCFFRFLHSVNDIWFLVLPTGELMSFPTF